MRIMNAKTLGDRIRELRQELDLSLREFGVKLGERMGNEKPITAAFLSDVELGRRFPSPEMLVQMAHVLRTTVEDLKSCDTRPPVEELKKLTSENPAYGFAFRKLVGTDVSPEELLKFIEGKAKRPKER
jgi:transcriptional regulator with XRE-family HTH domain